LSTDEAVSPQQGGAPPAVPPRPVLRSAAFGLHPAGSHRILTRGALVCGVLTLLLILAELEVGVFLGALGLAIAPVPLYVGLVLWLDRFEPEPPRTLAQTFAWGATVAVFVAFLVNSLAAGVVEVTAGTEAAEFFGAVLSAPVVEELSKGAALLVLFHELKDEFDGVVDGVVYAAMVGLGFAMVENVQYYGAAIEDGVETSVLTFVVRGVMSPFAHPLFTAMFGIGLGYVRERHGHPQSWAVPALGMGAAIGLHALWNLSAGLDDWFLAVYVLVMVPLFFGVLVVINVSLRREGRIIHARLTPLVDDGTLSARELRQLSRVRKRLAATARAFLSGGLRRWRLRREAHRVASELAFHRCRVDRGLTRGEDADALRDAAYLRRLRAVYRAIHR
jgi:protease PrsW